MGLLNSNQVLRGARTPAGEKTYAEAFLKEKPTVATATGTLTFTGGVVEVEGRNFSMNTRTFALNSLAPSLFAAGQNFVLALVPSYLEPASRAAAETANVPYYVQTNLEGESMGYSYLPSAIESAVAAKGGISALQQRVYMGTASADDTTVFNAYFQALETSKDPRYALTPFQTQGFDFVLVETVPQTNSPAYNSLLTKSVADFNLLRSQLPMLYTERKAYSLADANTMYANRTHLIQSAKSYTSLANAQQDVGGVTATVTPGATPFSAVTFVAVYEYTYPSNMPLGQIGYQDRIIRFLSKDQDSQLGRINPIYMYTQIQQRMLQKRAVPLTLYGDPQPLLTFQVGGTSGAYTALNPALIFDVI